TGRPRAEGRQTLQGFIQRDERLRPTVQPEDVVLVGRRRLTSAAFWRTPSAGVVDQDLPHRLRSDPEEVRAILERAVRVRKLEVGLMQERGGVERRRRALAPTLPVRQLMQLVVQQRQKRLKCFSIAVPRRVQEQRHVASILCIQTYSASERLKNTED